MNLIRTPKSQRVADCVAEGVREAALLWFVFSALDALVSGRLTFPWVTANSIGSILVWSSAMYLELVVKGARMTQTFIVADINPMYYGTLSFLMFSGMLLGIGFWALHNLKKEKKRRIGFTTSEPASRSRSRD